MRLRVACLLLLLGTVALLAAGCGDTVSLDPVAKAADVTSKQTSEHMTMAATVTGSTQTVTMAGSGDFQNDPNRGTLTLTVKGAGHTITMNAVLEDTSVYMSSDVLTGRLPDGKTWLKLDYGKELSALGLSAGALSSGSPSSALAALKATGTVTDDGPATVDGVATTHYSAIVDPGKITQVEKAANIDVSYGPLEVWIDGQGLVRRLQMSLLTGTPGSASEQTMSMTMTLSDYGETVQAAAPPDAEVYDATDLATSLLKK